MKVDIAVCGRFHYHKYLKYLENLGVINRLYCSYKIGFYFGINSNKIKNYFIKEYLMHFNDRYLKSWNYNNVMKFLHRLWEYQVLINEPQSDILHVMVHGNSLKIIEKYKRLGIPVIGEAVNAHPVVQREILSQEYSQYGLQYDYSQNREARMMQEFDLCDYILVASSFVEQSFLDRGYPKEKIIKIPYGIEKKAQHLPEHLLRTSEINILCVGAITFRKGQIYLLRAIQDLISEGYPIQLTLVGSIDPLYHNIIVQQGFEDIYTHVSHVDNAEMAEFMSNFDLFVLPSIEDGFSVVIPEAISVGLPVITTRNNGAADIVQNGINGWVVESNSVDQIKESILKTLESRSQSAPVFMDWEEYSKKLSELYCFIVLN